VAEPEPPAPAPGPGDDVDHDRRDRPGAIVVAGEALIDFVPAGLPGLFQAVPGGSPANVAVGLARLGVPVRMLARIAGDSFGQQIRAHLAGNRVDLSFAVRAEEPSSLAIVTVGQDGLVDYDFRVQGTADWQWRDQELTGAIDDQVLALHAGSLALTTPPGAQALHRLLERARRTATISYDPNFRPLLMGSPERVRAGVDHLITLADVVKASADDLAWLLPGRGPEEIAASWLAKGPAVVAVTLGPDGVVAATRQAGAIRRDGRRVEVVDTVGAGDAFMSALLAGLRSRNLLGASRRGELRAIAAATLAEVLDEAVLAAAITCTRAGAQPPTADELLAMLDADRSR
jgi:fructokinase